MSRLHNRDLGDGLADFVRGLPEGQRHRGTFWALSTAVEDGLPDTEINKVTEAAVAIGLGQDYAERTLRQIKKEAP